jgi:hypothetical protein
MTKDATIEIRKTAHGELDKYGQFHSHLNSQHYKFGGQFKMNTPLFESVDFYSSAFLIATGQKLQTTYKRGSQTVFIFEDSVEIQDLLNNYFAMQAEINASAYAQAIKNLKNIIHSGQTYSNHNSNNYERIKTT